MVGLRLRRCAGSSGGGRLPERVVVAAAACVAVWSMAVVGGDFGGVFGVGASVFAVAGGW